MKATIIILLALASWANAAIDKNGVKAPTSKKEYCANMAKPDYVKSLFYDRQNQISFLNRGGIGGGGVCWWHSMLTRSAQHLAVFRPELPKADANQAADIIKYLTQSKGVVEIPGYKNFYEFTYDYSTLVQNALDGWQIADGGFGFGWVRGVSGSHIVDPATLSKMMDDTFKVVTKEKKVAFQKIQMEGIEAHAWLVVDMIKNANGYTLEVVDSNYGGISKIEYTRGMSQLPTYNSVPYTSRNAMDYSAYKWAYSQYCKRNKSAADMDVTHDYN